MRFKPREDLSPKTTIAMTPQRVLLGIGIMIGVILGDLWLMMVVVANVSAVVAIASIVIMVLSMPITFSFMERKDEREQRRGLVAGGLIALGLGAIAIGLCVASFS